MYILGIIASLIAFGVFIDFRRGNLKDRTPHDTNPNNYKTNSSAENAFNSSGIEQHIP